MNVTHKTQKQQPGRHSVCRITSHRTGFRSLSIAKLQRSRFTGGYCPPVYWRQQRKTCTLRKGVKAERMDKRYYDSQGKERIACFGFALRNQKGDEAQQGKLVCSYMASLGLASGYGYFPVGLQSRGLSEKKILIHRKWSRRVRHSARKWSRRAFRYSRKWSYVRHFRHFIYFRFWTLSRYCHLHA